jgi:hypothetical protein
MNSASIGEPLVEVDLKKVVWPWLDELAFDIHIDAASAGGAAFMSDVVDSELVGTELAVRRGGTFFGLADTAKQAQNHVLTVGLDDECVSVPLTGFDKQISHGSLQSWMDMQFWLLYGL